MTDYLPIPRFPLPDDWSPEGYMCARVIIPNDPQYLETLTGLIDALRQSRTFARDETKTGAATVARTWDRALNQAPILASEDCLMFLLRQSPTDPCQMEQSTDGGETWTLAFDYALCSSVITAPAPFSENPSGAGDAAANVVKNIHSKLMDIADSNCAGSRDAAITEMLAWLRQYDAGYAGTGNLGAIYDAYCALTEPEREAAQELSSMCQPFNDLSECANVDGLFSALDCLNELLTEWLDNTNSDLMDLLNKAAGAMSPNGIQWAANDGGAGGSAGFGDCVVGWPLVYDFTLGQVGTLILENLTPDGAEGLLWSGTGYDDGRPEIIAEWPALYNVTSVTIEGNRSVGVDDYRFAIWLEIDNIGGTQASGATGYDSPPSYTLEADVNINRVSAYLWPFAGNLGMDAHITKLTINGAGDVPPY